MSFWGRWTIGISWVTRLSVSAILQAGSGDALVIVVVVADGMEALLWTHWLVFVVGSRAVLAWISSRACFSCALDGPPSLHWYAFLIVLLDWVGISSKT